MPQGDTETRDGNTDASEAPAVQKQPESKKEKLEKDLLYLQNELSILADSELIKQPEPDNDIPTEKPSFFLGWTYEAKIYNFYHDNWLGGKLRYHKPIPELISQIDLPYFIGTAPANKPSIQELCLRDKPGEARDLCKKADVTYYVLGDLRSALNYHLDLLNEIKNSKPWVIHHVWGISLPIPGWLYKWLHPTSNPYSYVEKKISQINTSIKCVTMQERIFYASSYAGAVYGDIDCVRNPTKYSETPTLKGESPEVSQTDEDLDTQEATPPASPIQNVVQHTLLAPPATPKQVAKPSSADQQPCRCVLM